MICKGEKQGARQPFAVRTPVGMCFLYATAAGVDRLDMAWGDFAVVPDDSEPGEMPTVLWEAGRQIEEYFRGERIEFDIALDISCKTLFQQQVLQACQAIPYGETRSYGELAHIVGRSGGARAVGQVMARNAVPLFIPCHRVIGSSGDPVGFAGGTTIKQYLLSLERGVKGI